MVRNAKRPVTEILGRNAAKAEAMLKQLAHAGRLLILCSLTEGEKTVGQLMQLVDLSQSAVSQHLAKLRDANLVECEKRGQMAYYRISSVEAQSILSVLYKIYCKPQQSKKN
jgi:ArsR family transcriptional regulator, virulence genes transcriptional regulator